MASSVLACCCRSRLSSSAFCSYSARGGRCKAVVTACAGSAGGGLRGAALGSLLLLAGQAVDGCSAHQRPSTNTALRRAALLRGDSIGLPLPVQTKPSAATGGHPAIAAAHNRPSTRPGRRSSLLALSNAPRCARHQGTSDSSLQTAQGPCIGRVQYLRWTTHHNRFAATPICSTRPPAPQLFVGVATQGSARPARLACRLQQHLLPHKPAYQSACATSAAGARRPPPTMLTAA